jgi:GNAT superfamily N-acetyltransferase
MSYDLRMAERHMDSIAKEVYPPKGRQAQDAETGTEQYLLARDSPYRVVFRRGRSPAVPFEDCDGTAEIWLRGELLACAFVVGMRPDWQQELLVAHVEVREEYRWRGLAKALLVACARRFGDIWLSDAISDEGARLAAWWERDGRAVGALKK